MKKSVLSVLSALLSTVLLVGCTPQPTVSTDAPATTRTATTTAAITTTAASSTTTPAVTTTTTTTTTVITTTTTTNTSAPATTTKKTTTKNTTPAEYSIRFEKDTSVGWKRLHKNTETTEHGDIIVTGSYIVDGNAKVYVNGKWISLKKAIKNDPTVMEKIWSKALRDNAAKSTEHAYPKDFITMRQLKGDGVNYAKYTGYTLTYWTAAGDNPGVTPCPVHEYPGIGDRKWEDLTEKEKQDYLKILREHEHSHNVRWYMILPPDAPIPTWDDIYEKGICYMDF